MAVTDHIGFIWRNGKSAHAGAVVIVGDIDALFDPGDQFLLGAFARLHIGGSHPHNGLKLEADCPGISGKLLLKGRRRHGAVKPPGQNAVPDQISFFGPGALVVKGNITGAFLHAGVHDIQKLCPHSGTDGPLPLHVFVAHHKVRLAFVAEAFVGEHAGDCRGKDAGVFSRFHRDGIFIVIKVFPDQLFKLLFMALKLLKFHPINIFPPIKRFLILHQDIAGGHAAVLGIKGYIAALAGDNMLPGMVVHIVNLPAGNLFAGL